MENKTMEMKNKRKKGRKEDRPCQMAQKIGLTALDAQNAESEHHLSKVFGLNNINIRDTY